MIVSSALVRLLHLAMVLALPLLRLAMALALLLCSSTLLAIDDRIVGAAGVVGRCLQAPMAACHC